MQFRIFLGSILILLSVQSSQAQKVNKALHLFLSNNSKDAESILASCANDVKHPEYAKANIALAIIKKFDEDDDAKVKHYVAGITALDNPDPYVYPLWGDCTFYNFPDYAEQLMKFYRTRKNIHPDVNSALLLLKSRMWQRTNHKDSILALNRQWAYIDQWELLGAFDYPDGFGFKNDEGTLQYADTTHVFTGNYDAPLKWFPLINNVDVKFMSMADFIPIVGSDKYYMQTFMECPSEQDVLLNITCGSDIRCWVNDALCFENRKNIVAISSLPYHLKVHLNKGVNRVLLQLGKKTEYQSNIDVSCTDSNYQPIPQLSWQLAQRNYKKAEKPFWPTITDPDIESFNIAYFNEYEKIHPEDLLEQLLRIEEFNTGSNKEKTLKALAGLLQKYPGSHYLLNVNFYNKNNVSYSSTNEYLSQNCPDCFTSLRKKYKENYDSKSKAEEYYNKMLQLYPSNYTLSFFKIRKLIEDKSYAAADSLLEQSWKSYKNKLAYWEMKQELMEAQNRKDDVAKMLETHIDEICYTNLSADLATYYQEKNDSLKWLHYYLRDAQFENSNEAYYQQADYYSKYKKYDSVDYIFQKLMLKIPNSAYIFERYGDALLEQNKKAEANFWYRKSLRYYPQDYELIKKIKDNDGLKTELEQLLPQNIKEIFASSKVSKIVVPESLSQHAWVMLLRREANVVYPKAYTHYKGIYFYKILNESGIKEFKEYNKSGDEAELLIFKANGNVVLPEGTSTWVLPDLQVGDIIGIKSEWGYKSTGLNSTHYQTSVMIDNNLPTVELDQQVLMSKKIDADAHFFIAKPEIKPSKRSWNDEFDLYEIKVKYPEYREPEVHRISEIANQTYLGISNYSSWKDFINWYWDIAASSIQTHDSITKLTNAILKGKENIGAFEKAKLLYQWVISNINYSSQSFRQDNYVPQLPNKVLQDKLGDCKDLSALYLSMCKVAGIKGHYVLVSTEAANTEKYKRFPNNFFNHCIAVIYPEGKQFFVELTAKYLAFGHNPMYTSYGGALIIDTSAQGEIIKVYNNNRSDDVLVDDYLSIDSSEIHAKGAVKLLGMTSAAVKNAYDNADNASSEAAAQKIITTLYPNSNQLKTSNNFKERGNDTIQIEYDFYNHEMFIDVADLEIIKLPTILNKLISESVISIPSRKTDFNIAEAAGNLDLIENRIQLAIPKGSVLYRKPQKVFVSNPFFEFKIDFNEIEDGLSIKKEFILKSSVINPSDYPEFRIQLMKAFKADVSSIVLQKI